MPGPLFTSGEACLAPTVVRDGCLNRSVRFFRFLKRPQ